MANAALEMQTSSPYVYLEKPGSILLHSANPHLNSLHNFQFETGPNDASPLLVISNDMASEQGAEHLCVSQVSSPRLVST